MDGATPQPVQKVTYDELLLFVVKQKNSLPIWSPVTRQGPSDSICTASLGNSASKTTWSNHRTGTNAVKALKTTVSMLQLYVSA